MERHRQNQQQQRGRRKAEDAPSSLLPILTFAAGVGVGLLAYLGVQAMQEDEPALSQQQEPSSSRAQTLEEWVAANENKSSDLSSTPIPALAACQICLDDRRKVTQMFECGHATCLECAVRIAKQFKTCPFDATRLTKPPKQLVLI